MKTINCFSLKNEFYWEFSCIKIGYSMKHREANKCNNKYYMYILYVQNKWAALSCKNTEQVCVSKLLGAKKEKW